MKDVTGESLSHSTLLAAEPVFCFLAQFRSTKSFMIELILSPEDSLIHSLPFRHPKLAFWSIFDQDMSQRCYGRITLPFNFAGGAARFFAFRLNLGVLNLV